MMSKLEHYRVLPRYLRRAAWLVVLVWTGVVFLFGTLHVTDDYVTAMKMEDAGSSSLRPLVDQHANSVAAGYGVIWLLGMLAVFFVSRRMRGNRLEYERMGDELRGYGCIVSSTTDGLALVGPDLVYRAANKAYAQLFAKTPEEVIGRTMAEIVGQEVFKSIIAPRVERCLTGEEAHYQEWFNFPVGGRKYMDVAYSPYRQSDDRVNGFAIAVRDITALKETENSLSEANRRIRNIYEAVHVGLLMQAVDGTIVDANGVALEILGMTEEAIKSNTSFCPQWRMITEDGATVPGDEHPSMITIRTGRPIRNAVRGLFTGNSDELRWLLINTEPLLDDETGDFTEVLITFADITAQKKAAEDLRDSAERFRELFEHMGSGVAVYEAVDDGEDFVFKDINPKGARIGKINRRDHIGKSVLDVYPGVKELGLFEVLQKVWRTGEPQNHPMCSYVDDRIVLWVENYVYRLPTGEVVAVYDDISEQKRAQAELESARSFLDTVVDMSPFAMWVSDCEGTIIRTNKSLRDTLDMADDQIIGVYNVLKDYNLEAQGVMPQVRDVFEKHKPAKFRLMWWGNKAGTPHLSGARDVYVDLAMFPILSVEGELINVVCQWVDITERKRAEELIESLAKFPQENPYPVLRAAPDGTLLYANEPSQPLLSDWGCAVDELLPETWREIVAKALDSGTMETTEVQAGQQVFTISIVPLTDKQYVNLYAVDITGRKELELQYAQAQKMEAIGQLAGGVAHDFRNQLTVIRGYADMMLRRDSVSEEDSQFLEAILEAVNRSTTTTNQLLVFSRKEMLRRETVDLTESVAEMSKLLQQMMGEDMRVVVVPSSKECCANVDPRLLQQAIMNLAVNSRHAMPDGGDLVLETGLADVRARQLRAHPHASAGDYAVVTVTDTGIGMEADVLTRVFDPFFTTKEVGMGTGMGLAMVYGFVAQSEGFIDVESSPGKGTTFRLYFPRVDRDQKTSGVVQIEEPDEAPTGSETLLVVEDEEALRHLAVSRLRNCGYTVLEAGSAAEALPLGEHYEERIDLMVTDIVMPRMSGIELAKRMKKARPDISVLFISGHSQRLAHEETLAGPDSELLSKPFGQADLAQAVRRLLDRRLK